MISKLVFFPLLLALAFACKKKDMNKDALQGIRGKVIYRSGNHMPTPDGKASGASKAAKRTMLVYEVLSMKELNQKGPFFEAIPQQAIDTLITAEDGTFETALPPGTYTLFSVEAQGLYANRFDGEGRIFPVSVSEGNYTEVEFIIDYDAAY